MPPGESRPRRRWIAAAIAAALLLVLALTIDDWRRDFTGYSAEISFRSTDHTLKPFVSQRPVDDLVLALQWAAKRLGGWEYVGTAAEDRDTFVVFVHRGRVLRFVEDDVRMRVRDRGDDRVVTGESRSRWQVGDLGRNPRNLRRLLGEMQQVLEAAE